MGSCGGFGGRVVEGCWGLKVVGFWVDVISPLRFAVWCSGGGFPFILCKNLGTKPKRDPNHQFRIT